jgi:hypothetical protein
VTLSSRSTLPVVARRVGEALSRHGVDAVLTGGACASLHTRGRYVSVDVDFILLGSPTRDMLDRAMSSIGFSRKGDRYVHAKVRFYVEFPKGPLAIGGDVRIRPRRYRSVRGDLRALSPTDSCRDRLAAFYHWSDRQSLDVAVAVALRNRVDLTAIRAWSRAEDKLEAYGEFLHGLKVARATRGRSR